MTALAAEKFARLTTFTKDGRSKHTTVWFVDLGDGTVGITTPAHTWKVKRIRTTPAVELTPSDRRGRVKDEAGVLSGGARLVSGTELAAIESAHLAKYGVQFRLWRTVIKIMHRLGRDRLSGIVVKLD